MSTNLGKSFKVFILFSSIIFPNLAFGQSCSQTLDFQFKPSSSGSGINWGQFPEFSLPFKVVYGGASRFSNFDLQLKRGFTHFANPNNLALLPVENRAFILYGVAYSNPFQPWSKEKSPFGNDMQVYYKHWDNEVKRIITETNGKDRIAADIFVLDIEAQIKSNDSILVLKNSNTTPKEYKVLSNDLFIQQYKKSLQGLYAETLSYLIEKGKPANEISSYADTPILNTFINIQGKSWESWKKDNSSLNSNLVDFNSGRVGGPFDQKLTTYSPSAYYYYDYPHPFAGEYLSYLLFQLEANRAWSDKDQMLFVWLKYSYTPEYVLKNIKPWMAEATAIFPFFGGAKSIWLWENSVNDTDDLSNYEYFTKGLYRLSKFKEMFEGDYKLVETVSARDYNENKKPIWRGVFKDNNLLVVAHNPNAKSETEEVKVVVSYGNWNKEITLKGYEIFLCKYDLNIPTALLPEINTSKLNCFPNPSNGLIDINLKGIKPGKIAIKICGLDGKILSQSTTDNQGDFFDAKLKIEKNWGKQVIINALGEGFNLSNKVIIVD